MGLREILKNSPYWGFFIRLSKLVLRFSAVAMCTTGLNLAVTNILFYVFDVYYILAMGAGFGCQVLPESYINSRWTFKKTEITWLVLLLLTNSIELLCFGIASVIEYVAFDLLKYSFWIVRVGVLPITGVVSFTLTTYLVRRLTKNPLV